MTDAEHRDLVAALELALAHAGGKLESAAAHLSIHPSMLYRYLHDGVRPRRKTLERMGPRLDDLRRRTTAAMVARQLGPSSEMEVSDDDEC